MIDDKIKAKNVAFLKSPDEWPMWPFCPIKKADHSFTQSTLMYADKNGMSDPAVPPIPGLLHIDCNVFLITREKIEEALNEERWLTPEEVLEAGWIVD